MPADFDQQSYWQSRFASETAFEWLTPSATFMSLIDPVLRSAATAPDRATGPSILQLGSGTSDLHNHLRARGYADVTNADYEPLALERGRDIEAREFGDVRTRYVLADVRQLQRDLGAAAHRTPLFDVVLDKGTADAVACGGTEAVLDMVRGVRGCLAEGGCWISLSYSSSRFDVPGLPFSVEVIGKIATPKRTETDPEVYHWCYLLRPN
ncbi:S-adenosyl-L-methionine-dependent methyltransferase [Biscogniauxia mediterranea]|nr:S-adenosyl-L-methionine-dependent methyltransferase [Biscogniauxia mediterranea]